MPQVASVVAVVLLRRSPFPRPDRALMHQLVLVDVADVAAVTTKVVPVALVVLTRNLRCLVGDLPAVVAGSVLVVQHVRVPAVPAPVAGCTRPNPRRLGRTEYH